MGRSLSTPGLVESKGRIPLEEMTLAVIGANGDLHLPSALAISGRDSPVASTSGASAGSGTDGGPDPSARRAALHMGPLLPASFPPSRLGQPRTCADSAFPSSQTFLLSPSGLSASLEVSPATECTGLSPASTSEHVSGPQLAAAPAAAHAASPQHDVLVAEIKRLRERLVTLETENAAMSYKLSQQQWEVEHRLAEIEMHICAGADANGEDNNERNRESII